MTDKTKHTEEPWECDHKPVSIGQGYNGHQLYIRSGDHEITGAMGHVSILTKHATDETRKALKAQCHTVIEENEEPPYTSEMMRIVACVNACKGINPEAVPMMVEITELAQILSGDIVGAKSVTVAQHLRLMNLCEKAIAKARETNE